MFRSIISGRRTAFLTLATAIITALLGLVVMREDATPPLVCLDPGHGGNTGAFNVDLDLTEDEINLDVALRLEALLQPRYRVVLTRRENEMLPLEERAAICNAQDADILVSVHTNSIEDTDFDGVLGLYLGDQSRILSQTIHDILYPGLNNVGWDFLDFGLDRFTSPMLRQAAMPAVIVEAAMLSHPAEAQLLLERGPDSRRWRIAELIAMGIDAYFGQ